MAKSDPAERLLRRLEKIQRAHGRLGDIHTRILAQAEALAQLLKDAETLATPSPARKAAAPRPRAGAKKAAAKRTPRKPASAKSAATTRRRAPRRPVSA